MRLHYLVCVGIAFAPAVTLGQPSTPAPLASTALASTNGLRLMPATLSQYPASPPVAEPILAGHPQPPGRTLADLEGMALANNPTLTRSAARVDAARGQWLQVGMKPNPVIGYMGNQIGDQGRAGQQGGFVQQEIVTAGKLRLNRDVAAQEIRQTEQQFEAQRLRVLNDVKLSFYDVLVAERMLSLTQELLRVGEQGVKAADGLLAAKEVSRVDLLQARVELGSARIVAENTRNRYIAAWRKLAAVLGVPDMAPVPLIGDLNAGLAEIEWSAALQGILTSSPELAAAQAGVWRAQRAIARARVEPRPNIEAMAGAQHDYGSGYDLVNVQVGIPIPFFNRNQGNLRKAVAELAAAQTDVRRLELDLQQRLAAAYERYANARQQVNRYAHDILPDAKASLALVDGGYRQGEFGYLTLLTAQRTFFQTNIAYLESLRQLRESSVTIEGLLLTDSLQQP